MRDTLYLDFRAFRPMRMTNGRIGFPVDLNKKPDAFLRVPRGTQSRRGSASTAATHRARQVLAKLGL